MKIIFQIMVIFAGSVNLLMSLLVLYRLHQPTTPACWVFKVLISDMHKYDDFVKHVEPNKDFFVTEEQKAAYQKKYEDLYRYAKGNPGYNFELKDVNDKTCTGHCSSN